MKQKGTDRIPPRVCHEVLVVTLSMVGLLVSGIPAAATSLFGPSYFKTGEFRTCDVQAVDIDGNGTKELAINAVYEYHSSDYQVILITSSNEITFNDWAGGSGGAFSGLPSPFVFVDLNHDHQPDFVGSLDGYNLVEVSIRDSSGRPLRVLRPEVGGAPIALIAADFDEDGHVDVIASHENGYSLLRGVEDGGFRAAVNSPVNLGVRPLAVADFNLDGHLDLASALGVFLGDGSGGFGANRPYGPEGLFVVSDFDADGTPDLASIPDGRSDLQILIGNGDGTFTPTQGPDVDGSPVDLAIGDLNEDARTDLVVGTREGTVHVLTRTREGSFAPARTHVAGFPVSRLDVLDVDHDGHQDVAVAGGPLTVLTGNGDGTLDGVVSPAFEVARDPCCLVVDDLNGDRRPDIVTANDSSGTISILLGHEAGSFVRANDVLLGGSPSGVFTADLNRDLIRDLVVHDGTTGIVSALLGHGDGSFGPAQRGPSGVVELVAVRDMNQDGLVDVVARTPPTGTDPGGLAIALGLEDGSFGELQSVHAPGPGIVRVADLNADGYPDLTLVTVLMDSPDGDPHLHLFDALATGAGTFDWAIIRREMQADGFPTITAIGSTLLNRDLREDLLIVYEGRENSPEDPVFCWVVPALSSASGTNFTSGLSTASPGPRFFATGDLDGDGNLDVAFTRRESRRTIDGRAGVTVLLGSGEGGLAWEGEYFAGANPGPLACIDVNDDGKADLVVVDRARNQVRVLLNEGSRRAAPPPPLEVSATPGDASVVVKWRSALQPGIAAYRLYYGVSGADPDLRGDFAAEGVSGITLPADASSFTLRCVTGQRVAVAVRAVGQDGREGPASNIAASGGLPLRGDVAMWPKASGRESASRWVTVGIELHAGYDPRNIVPESVRLNHEVEGEVLRLVDSDRDGIEELLMRFPRTSPRTADQHPVVVSGVLHCCKGFIPFTADDSRPAESLSIETDLLDSGKGEDVIQPMVLSMRPLSPNPAQTYCDVAFDVPQAIPVRIGVFDVKGRSIGRLVDGPMPPGRHVARWKTGETKAGLYLVRMEAGAYRAVRKVAVTR